MRDDRKFNIHEMFNVPNLLRFIVSLVILTLVFILIAWSYEWKAVAIIDGTFVSGAIGIGIGILSFVTNQGTFDVFTVGFANLASVMKKDGRKRYDGLFEYRNIKESKRKTGRFNALVYFTAGLIYMILAIILYFSLYQG